MTDAQRAAAVKLLKTGLSAKGFAKVEAIRSLESVLYDIEGDAGKKPFVGGDGHPHRYPERYLFTIFGTPSATEPWGWRFEGHHISQNWTVVSGSAIASSPQFFGSNPAEVRTGPQDRPARPRRRGGSRPHAPAVARRDAAPGGDGRSEGAERHLHDEQAPGGAAARRRRRLQRPHAGPAAGALEADRGIRLRPDRHAGPGPHRGDQEGRRRHDQVRVDGRRREGRPALLPRAGRQLRHRVRQHPEQQQPHPRGVARLQRRLRPRHPGRALQGGSRLVAAPGRP